jgi:hypothetical protein
MSPRCTRCAGLGKRPAAAAPTVRPAGWRCTVCKALLCAEHVATHTVQVGTTIPVCLSCGEMAEVLTRHRSEGRPYLKRLGGALLWPLGRAGLFAMFGMGVGRAIFSYSLGGWVAGTCALAAMCFALMRITARGSDDFEILGYADLFADLILPGVQALLGLAIAWAPAGIWVAMRVSNHDVELGPGLLADPMFWALLIAGFLYAPMAIMIGASGSGLLRMLNPVVVAGHAVRLGSSYVAAVGLLVGLSLLGWLLAGVGTLVNLVPVPFFPRVVDYMLGCYAPFVAARVLGLLLHTRGDAVGYGLPTDYLDPVLPGVEPAGVPPQPLEQQQAAPKRSFAPIELAEEEPVPAAASVTPELPRPRLTELDPSQLPPLPKAEE